MSLKNPNFLEIIILNVSMSTSFVDLSYACLFLFRLYILLICFLFSKIDVYSFGLLLCEMCIRELPVPQQTQQQISMVTDHVFRSIIQGCVRHVPTERPTMDDVLKELETMGIAQNGLSRVLLPK